jgi:hypothetical protein
MRKKTIGILLIIGIILFAVGYGIAIAGASGNNAGLASAGLGIYGIGGIVYFISWIGTLVATGKQGRWGWFVCTFLLSPIAEIVYLFAGPAIG